MNAKKLFLVLTILLNVTLFRLCVCVEGVKFAPPSGQRVTYIDIPKLDNVRWANVFFPSKIKRQNTDVGPTCYLHWESNVGKPIFGQYVYFFLCIFHLKYEVGKRTSGLRVIYIGNLMLENRRRAKMLF